MPRLGWAPSISARILAAASSGLAVGGKSFLPMSFTKSNRPIVRSPLSGGWGGARCGTARANVSTRASRSSKSRQNGAARIHPMRRLLFTLALSLAAGLAYAQAPVSIMHGFADMATMTLWLQTERAARIAVDLHVDGEAAKRRRIEGTTRAEDDFALHVRLTGLEP